ncbi:hypothetical protein ATG_11730 [Desulfurococcaceae archaeon AG1]|jgi:uncharacterized protein (UPF0218 family)|nr:MAG: hypothetical protein DJ555_01235 [Desulfurococcaceae archaeon]GAY25970.1 hypothetical protein ATG_11730 [Desulfurococcaceae archaeon AG1]
MVIDIKDKIYQVPERLRGVLSRGYGVIVEGSDRVDVARRILGLIVGRRVWSVGDVVTRSLIDVGFLPDVAVIDRATLREQYIETGEIEDLYRVKGTILEVVNPRGHISSEAIHIIKDIAGRSGGRFLLIVRGEEDMLSLVIAGVAGYGDSLLYGVPGRGVSVIIIDRYIRSLALDLLKEILGEDFIRYFG